MLDKILMKVYLNAILHFNIQHVISTIDNFGGSKLIHIHFILVGLAMEKQANSLFGSSGAVKAIIYEIIYIFNCKCL